MNTDNIHGTVVVITDASGVQTASKNEEVKRNEAKNPRGTSTAAVRTITSEGVRRLIIAATMCLLSEASTARQLPASAQPLRADKVLIVYLSRTGNTKAIADIIHQEVGGTMVELELEKRYPTDYDNTVQQVSRENETGYLPPLRTKIDRIQQYDVVFLGFPTWGMQLPPPIKSFLNQYNLKGKTVIPFNTNAGFGEGSSFRTVRELCSECTALSYAAEWNGMGNISL